MAIEVPALPFTRLPCLCGLNETLDCGYRFPPLAPRLRPFSPQRHVRCLAECYSDARGALRSASHRLTSGSSLVLPPNSRTPTISSSLCRFTMVHAFSQFFAGASSAPAGHSATRVASRGGLPSFTPHQDVGFFRSPPESCPAARGHNAPMAVVRRRGCTAPKRSFP
jgi:hypothetical protein